MNLPDDTQKAMDKDNVLLLGLTACALGLSLFILWGPKLSRRSINNCSLIGLQNLGLTCFLNSLLQALASCPSFIDWLQSCHRNGSVTDSLLSILKLLCYEREPDSSDDVYSPDDLICNLRGKVWPIFPQEQDPHELFLHLLTALEEEEQKATPERVESLLDALDFKPEMTERTRSSQSDNSAVVTSHGDVHMVNKIVSHEPERPTLTPNPFRGYLASQLSCLKCGSKSAVVYDKFDSLSLALPPKGTSFKLQTLLEDFVSPELVDGFACDFCNKDRPPDDPLLLSQANKAIKIGKLPKCLCFHISRTYIDSNGYMYKREHYIDFPEFLHMKNYTHTNSMLKERKVKKIGATLASGVSGGTGGDGSSSLKFPKSVAEGSVIGGVESDPTLTKYKSLRPTALSESLPPISVSDNNNIPPSPPLLINNAIRPSAKNMNTSGPVYRLKSVVEHRGTVDSGHFVTYRRGPLESDIRHRSNQFSSQSESRWFFTSDEIVRKSSLCDTLSAYAYLLFYEKCVSTSL